MPAYKNPNDLSVEELRRLLIDKQKNRRAKNLEHFRKSGRVIQVEPALPISPFGLAVDVYNRNDSLLPEDSPIQKVNIWRRVVDRLLFVIEIAAVIGFIYIVVSGFNMMQNLNREVANVLIQPTPSETPIISAVVLPSGHIPPSNGITRFNEEEIPSHLRPMMQSINASMLIPTPGPTNAVKIKIPGINVFAPIVQGDGWEQLKKGVGQHSGTVDPGQQGNLILSAHNDVFAQLFRDLDQLKQGDEIILYTNDAYYTYVVRQTLIVEPSQVEVMANTREAVVTLISCYPYLIDNQRIVVVGDLLKGN